MKDNEIVERVISAMIKVQSALHDLDVLPEDSTFKKTLKKEFVQMVKFNSNFVSIVEKQLNETTKLLNMEASQTYVDMVTKFDELGTEIRFFVNEHISKK